MGGGDVAGSQDSPQWASFGRLGATVEVARSRRRRAALRSCDVVASRARGGHAGAIAAEGEGFTGVALGQPNQPGVGWREPIRRTNWPPNRRLKGPTSCRAVLSAAQPASPWFGQADTSCRWPALTGGRGWQRWLSRAIAGRVSGMDAQGLRRLQGCWSAWLGPLGRSFDTRSVSRLGLGRSTPWVTLAIRRICWGRSCWGCSRRSPLTGAGRTRGAPRHRPAPGRRPAVPSSAALTA